MRPLVNVNVNTQNEISWDEELCSAGGNIVSSQPHGMDTVLSGATLSSNALLSHLFLLRSNYITVVPAGSPVSCDVAKLSLISSIYR